MCTYCKSFSRKCLQHFNIHAIIQYKEVIKGHFIRSYINSLQVLRVTHTMGNPADALHLVAVQTVVDSVGSKKAYMLHE